MPGHVALEDVRVQVRDGVSRHGDGFVALARRANDQADRAPLGDLGANLEAQRLEGALEALVQLAAELPYGRAALVAACAGHREDIHHEVADGGLERQEERVDRVGVA